MKKLIISIVVILIVILAGVWYLTQHYYNQISSSSSPSPTASVSASNSPSGQQSVSDGTITIKYNADQFGLATDPQQILTQSYIPPCDQDFKYCFYYTGNEYQGTNFESAGVRVQPRTDLTTQTQCLNAWPAGYSNIQSTKISTPDYQTAFFPIMGQGAAGHISQDDLYRLYYQGKCYEFQTRIGQSEYGNYPAGTIKQFTSAAQTNLQNQLNEILKSVTLSDNKAVTFPPDQR